MVATITSSVASMLLALNIQSKRRITCQRIISLKTKKQKNLYKCGDRKKKEEKETGTQLLAREKGGASWIGGARGFRAVPCLYPLAGFATLPIDSNPIRPSNHPIQSSSTAESTSLWGLLRLRFRFRLRPRGQPASQPPSRSGNSPGRPSILRRIRYAGGHFGSNSGSAAQAFEPEARSAGREPGAAGTEPRAPSVELRAARSGCHRAMDRRTFRSNSCNGGGKNLAAAAPSPAVSRASSAPAPGSKEDAAAERKALLRPPGGTARKGPKRRVQWKDTHGKKLVEVLEFQPSDSSDSDDEYLDTCICSIM